MHDMRPVDPDPRFREHVMLVRRVYATHFLQVRRALDLVDVVAVPRFNEDVADHGEVAVDERRFIDGLCARIHGRLRPRGHLEKVGRKLNQDAPRE